MTTFDTWEAAIRPPEDYLMHFRTKGSKNGVRRYQNPDGSWTEVGLAERRKREGWGDKIERKLQKKVAKAERKQARKAARAERQQAAAEARRKRKLSGLTDEEMKAKLERAKMEAEYRDLTRRHTAVETGAKLIGKYLEYRNVKEQNAIEMNKQKLEMERLKTQQIQAKEATKQSHNRIKTSANEAKQAEAKAEQTKADVRGGLKLQRKQQLKETKIRWRDGTIHGGVQKKIHDTLAARGEGKAERIKERSFTTAILRNRKRIDKYNSKLDPWQEKQSYDPDPWNRDKNAPRKKEKQQQEKKKKENKDNKS